ncbi:MAG: site-2 protease family protein [Candidatus Niyogibacteria bacterium]|nr:site-2 protease family protein [Candidatus Niyogibacteria bacterium]
MKQTKTLLRVLLSLLILESAFAIHEYGHLREFQKRGVPVKEFSLGIGPSMYQYQTDSSLTVSFRLIPIMAYVAPTEEGGNLFKKQGSLWNKIAVDLAGVRNNFLVGLAIILFLQILGWRRGNLSAKELAGTAMVTPFKIPLRFVAFLVGCVTWGRINLAEKFLLSTGGIDPPKPLKSLILWNLTLGLFNLAPIPPLDGGHALEAVLLSAGTSIYISEIPKFVGVILFAVYCTTAGNQDMRVLEVEPRSDSVESRRGTTKRRSSGALGRWEEEGEEAPSFFLVRRITHTHLPTRVRNILEDSSICTIGELRETTASQLLQIKGFGLKSLEAVEKLLRDKGLSLKPE